jgi:hypothetical protein
MWRGALLAVAACGRVGFDAQPTPVSLDVEPLYPGFVAWSDYVRASDPTTACDGSEPGGPDACIHAGEARTVAIDADSCDGLVLRDELGALQWRCEDQPAVHFVGGGLRPDRSLRDLLDADGWRPERVVLWIGGRDVAASELEVWWPDPVMPLPDDGQLATPAIYTLATSRATRGFTIAGNGIAVVTLGDAVLSPTGDGAPNCEWNLLRCLIVSTGTSFLWLEVHATGAPEVAGGAPGDRAIDLENVTFSTIRATTTEQLAEVAIVFTARASRIYDLTASEGTNTLLSLKNSAAHNVLQHVRLYDSDAPIALLTSDAGAIDNTLVDVVAAGAPNTCFASPPGPATLSHVLAGGCDEGIVVYSAAAHDITLAHTLAVARMIPLDITYGSSAVAADTVATDGGLSVRVTSATARFTGVLVTGSLCQASGIGGLDDSCADAGTSDASVTTGASLASSFVGGLPGYGRGAGAVWDWHLVPGDTVLAGRDGPLADACAGMRWLDDGRGNVFAVDAIEIPGDNLGDDDGLCESGEACLYSPNLGLDQGSGDYSEIRCANIDVALYANQSWAPQF